MEETNKIRKRSEIPVEDTWATEDLYPTEEAWEETLKTLEADKDTLAAYAGRLGESGQILYDGRDFIGMTKREQVLIRREMGMIFQSAALFDSMSVLENVMFPLEMFSDDCQADRIRRAKFCLERVNLKGAENKLPGEISGGMQKRVAIARAIALNPKYLFCDEPNSGLDPKTSLVIDELIHDITQEYKMTTIINTHDMNSVMGIGENILYMYKGQKEWQGSKDQIMTSTNERLNSFIFASDLFRKVKEANQ